MVKFSFDENEYELARKADLEKQRAREIKERDKKKGPAYTGIYIHIRTNKVPKKIIKEYNRPKEEFFILPNGVHTKTIFISGLGKGIIKLSVDKVIRDIQFCDKAFASANKKKGKVK